MGVEDGPKKTDIPWRGGSRTPEEIQERNLEVIRSRNLKVPSEAARPATTRAERLAARFNDAQTNSKLFDLANFFRWYREPIDPGYIGGHYGALRTELAGQNGIDCIFDHLLTTDEEDWRKDPAFYVALEKILMELIDEHDRTVEKK